MRNIRTRIASYILLIAIIPIAAFLIYSFVFVNQEVKKTKIDATESKLNWASQYVDSVVAQLEDISYSIQIEAELMDKIDNIYTDSSEIEDIIRNFLYINSNLLSSISIFSINTLNEISIDYENGTSKAKLSLDNAYLDIFTEPTGLGFHVQDNVITTFHSVNNFSDQNFEGGIILTLNKNINDEIQKIFSNESNYILATDREVIINSTTDSDMDLSEIIEQYDSSNLNIFSKNVDSNIVWVEGTNLNNLYVMTSVPLRKINSFNDNLINISIFIVLIIFLISIPISILLSSRISVPIIKLVNHMNEFNFAQVNTLTKPYDEITLLERSYNKMIEKVNQLIQHEYQNEIDNKDAQLKALQAQINPHFLSNTFQLIGGMALAIKAENIYDATIKMSHLVRYSMNINLKDSSLGDEINHIKDYLDIQKLRFGNRLTFNIKANEKVKTIKLPKFTLQPIIENCFQHGLQSVEHDWKINIKTKLDQDIHILISDNGVGVSQSEIDKINAQFVPRENYLKETHDSTASSVGLRNIDSRIKLLYGNKYGLEMSENSFGQGLKITITIPRNGVSS